MCIRPFLYLSLHQTEYLLLRRALLVLECAWWQRHTGQQLKRSHEIANSRVVSRTSPSVSLSACSLVRPSLLFLSSPYLYLSLLSFLALSFFLSLSHFRCHNILYLLTDSFYRSQSFISFLTTDDVCTAVLLFTCRSFLLFRFNENKT